MSLIWADIPTNSPGIYSAINQMPGIWGAAGAASLQDDPSPTITGNVLRIGQVSLADSRMIFAYPSDVTTMIAAKRIWINALPTSNAALFFGFQNNAGVDICGVRPTVSGNLSFINSSNAIVKTSTSSVTMTPASWHHVEVKVTVNGTTLSYEVRLDGVSVLSGSYADSTASLRRDTFKVNYYTPLDTANDFYVKDVVYANGTGSVNNDFFGTVSVTLQSCDNDITLGWNKSTPPLTGHELVDDLLIRGRFSATSTIDTSGVLRIDSTYYQLTTGSVDAGTPTGTSSNPWKVAKGLTDTITAKNFVDAINATGTPGTTYSTALTAHPTVAAIGYAQFSGFFDVAFQSKNGITIYPVSSTNTYISATAMSNALRVDIGYIGAGLTEIDTPSEFGLTDLPPDTTSVKGLISVAKLMKVDGGDATVVMSLGDGVNYDDGAAQNVQTSPAYYHSVSELNPTSNSPWTPVQANAAQFKINRTV